MRYASPRLLTILTVGALAIGGCGDDAADDNRSSVPGVSSNTGSDSDVSGTSLPALTDPQMTAAPNPNAGGGGEGAGTSSAP
jgi:hypothetical protein